MSHSSYRTCLLIQFMASVSSLHNNFGEEEDADADTTQARRVAEGSVGGAYHEPVRHQGEDQGGIEFVPRT
jgi:hypothetical protein